MIHHITAICADAQRTSDFYTNILGLRLVKLTVNQDDVGTYHLYFGDRVGAPGTVMTFFPWAYLPQGTLGVGCVSAVAFAVPPGALHYWESRLNRSGINVESVERFGVKNLLCADPDGLKLEFTESPGVSDWTKQVSQEYAIHSFFGATLMVQDATPTQQMLMEYFNYSFEAHAPSRMRLRSASGGVIDIISNQEMESASQGTGSVHHIAFRTADNMAQRVIRARLVAEYLHPTPIIDRYYFASVYFREPGGILFEIATDGPGFTVDETEAALGTKLVLPPRIEAARAEILKMLPPFEFNKK